MEAPPEDLPGVAGEGGENALPGVLPDVLPDNLREAPVRVRDALRRYAESDLESWHYRRTRISEDGTLEDRHDPSLPGSEHWQLVRIDGRDPTEDEREDYEDDRADHSKPNEKATAAYVSSAIAPGSIRQINDDTGAERYAFALRSPDGKRESTFRKLVGDMVLVDAEDGPWVQTVRVWNAETLRPVIGVRIDEVLLSFSFELLDGVVLPTAVQAEWQGEFLMVKDLDSRIEVTLTDFRREDPLTEKRVAKIPDANPLRASQSPR